MPELKKIQKDLQKIRKQREAEQLSILQARENLKKINQQKLDHSRRGPESEIARRLKERGKALHSGLSAKEANLKKLLERENRLREDYKSLVDPRKNIQELSDRTPVLLFPVRLETRFKITASSQHQLWVRIFPDSCSIDTFEEILSEAELKNARNYWIALWKAGHSKESAIEEHIRKLKKGAWKGLIGSSPAGRAYWTLQNYQPLNLKELPKRKSLDDIFLVIPTEMLPSQVEQKALQIYWRSIFLGMGVSSKSKAAFRQLVLSLQNNTKRAQELIDSYTPVNMQEKPSDIAGVPNVQVSFLLFPASGTVPVKKQSWTLAPRVKTFPDRFVLMGYKDGKEVFPSQVGEIVPNPLIIGPDPLENLEEVLKEAYKQGDIGNGEASFESIKNEEKVELYVEYLSKKAETKWLFNFEAAIQSGLGFKVNLSEAQYHTGFDRLMVIGVKMSEDEKESKEALEKLLQHHHFGPTGFSIIPQGTPTNNTEDKGSGYTGADDIDETFARYIEDQTGNDPEERRLKKDGRWLAELLGIDQDASSLKRAANYYGTDQSESMAMNTSLWPATIGYFMDSMMSPVFSDWQKTIVRWYFENHVSGRGRLPAVRIGNQPYGILPTSAISRLGWLTADEAKLPFQGFSNIRPALKGMYHLLIKVKKDWSAFEGQVAFVGKKGDAHKTLLEVLGLHASSQEFYQRYAQGFSHLYHHLLWIDPLFAVIAYGAALVNIQDARDLLSQLGFNTVDGKEGQPAMLEKAFSGRANLLKGFLIDDRPLSELDGIRAYTNDGKNYIEWLYQQAHDNFDLIQKQEGFKDNKPPQALLYQMLRHALNLAFSDTSLQLHRDAQILEYPQAKAAYVDADYIGFSSQKETATSKWDYLYRTEPRITNSRTLTVEQHISGLLRKKEPVPQLGDIQKLVEALSLLSKVPTARLERVFAEHLDCCTYRLDAWLLGLVNMQLYGMRYGGDFTEENFGNPSTGIYLGAFGWVENLKPDDRELKPVDLSGDKELETIFNSEENSPLVHDSSNAGYVHAPSLNHAVTAAVLRNAYLSNASKEKAEAFKVNLSSERVRMALSIIEGMQQGQSLGALLGYQLERGLHERYQLTEVDFYIYELRKAFPLVSNRMKSTEVAEEDLESVSQIEARNVVNGLALIDHISKTNQTTYPFGKNLENTKISNKQRQAIQEEVERIRNINDAVADLAMAESVHQVVQGNYDRAAGTLDAYSKGNYPQMPDVIRTPRSGVGLTHRVGIHLPYNPTPPPHANPRAMAEPAINQWLSKMVPNLGKVFCLVSLQLPSYGSEDPHPISIKKISLASLNLNPIDLIYTLATKGDKNLQALDDYILFQVMAGAERPDTIIEIKHVEEVVSDTDPEQKQISFFELTPLVERLRSLLLAARPLRPSDIMLPNEADESQDQQVSLSRDRIQAPLTVLENLISVDETIDNIPDLLELISMDLSIPENLEVALDSIDDYVAEFVSQLREANLFGIPEAGFGFVYERISVIYREVYKKLIAYTERWEEKLATYEDLVNEKFASATTEEEKVEVLIKAERSISTTYTIPVPPTSAQFKSYLANGNEVAFRNKFNTIKAFLKSPYPSKLSTLIRGVLNLDTTAPALDAFDVVKIDITNELNQIKVLTEDLANQSSKLVTSIEERITKVKKILTKYDGLANPTGGVKLLQEAAQILFGDDFKLYPAFNLNPLQASEIKSCLQNKNQLLAYQKTEEKIDFPVDHWLYGVARVREKMGDWEKVVVLAEALQNNFALDLTPLQLPHDPEDSWMALRYPKDQVINKDKLLYTAHIETFDASKMLSGILIDEWTEVIPTEDETTGLTFHYDRPNHEPPQSLLLVTPAQFTGKWRWNDLVDALHETLDLARMRAIEPVQIDKTPYAHFLPATISSVTHYPVTIALNYAINNGLIIR